MAWFVPLAVTCILLTSVGGADDDVCSVSGRVVDANGEAIAGALVYAMPWNRAGSDGNQVLSKVECGMDGEFEISFRKSQYTRVSAWPRTVIAAFAEGYAPNWERFNRIENRQTHEFVLDAVEQPLTAKINGPNGNPMAGVTVDMITVSRPDEQRPDGSLTLSDMNMWIEGDPLKEKLRGISDEQGRVEIPNLARENLYYRFLIHGPGITTERHDANLLMDKADAEFDFIYHAKRSTPVNGIVRDAATGSPVPGVTVKCRHGDAFGLADYPLTAISDENGKLTIKGFPMDRNIIVAIPNQEQCYLVQGRRVEMTDDEHRTVEFNLETGVWIDGQITDNATGKPISANVVYVPDRENPNRKKFYNRREYREIPDRSNRNDGRYRIVGLAGKGTVKVTALTPYPDSLVQEVNIEDSQTSVNVDFVIDQGQEIRIRALDDKGKAMNKLGVQGLRSADADWGSILQSEFVAQGFKPNEKRVMVFLNDKRQLGTIKLIAAQQNDVPRTVKLQPMSVIMGRIIDEQGDPIRGAQVNFDIVEPGNMRRALNWRGTDASGVFVQEFAAPGATYQLRVYMPGGETKVVGEVESLKPGEFIEFGNLDGKEIKSPEKRSPRTDR